CVSNCSPYHDFQSRFDEPLSKFCCTATLSLTGDEIRLPASTRKRLRTRKRPGGLRQQRSGDPMHDALTDGVIRKMWIDRAGPYRDHLLRLDADSRRNRFGGAVSDEFILNYIELSLGLDVVIHGFFVDGALRGVAELRPLGRGFADEAEAAFSIEQPWQSHGVGTTLLERTLLAARNRGIKLLHMHCLVDNGRMQQLARKFEANLKFDFGSVVGEVDPPRYTPLSLLREAVVDSHGMANAWLEAQSRLLGVA